MVFGDEFSRHDPDGAGAILDGMNRPKNPGPRARWRMENERGEVKFDNLSSAVPAISLEGDYTIPKGQPHPFELAVDGVTRVLYQLTNRVAEYVIRRIADSANNEKPMTAIPERRDQNADIPVAPQDTRLPLPEDGEPMLELPSDEVPVNNVSPGIRTSKQATIPGTGAKPKRARKGAEKS